MRPHRNAFAALAAAAALAGCASAPPQAAGLPFRELPAQSMAPGRCATFLWSASEPRLRILRITGDPAMARAQIGQRVVDFTLIEESGAPVAGQPPRQSFRARGARLSVDLSVAQRAGLSDGAVIESGLLTYVSPRGVSTIAPVVGLVGCQPRG